ncbi:MAG TPA: TIR domain-containing protein [Allosphingosinicella sp.]|jgi:predicted nucleotide-binding protein
MRQEGPFKIAVSFDRDSATAFYEALIDRLQSRDTAVYGNNLTHFFPDGPGDFGDHVRMDDALRHPDLIIVLMSKEYLSTDWLRSEVDGFLRLERARKEEGLVLIVPTGEIDPATIPSFYARSTKPTARLTTPEGEGLEALAAYVEQVREARNAVRSNKIFIVHGHDDRAKHELEHFLSEIGLEPVILDRHPDRGRTILEKFEKHSSEGVGFAIALLTPDDAVQAEEGTADAHVERRARQNVIFELGFFLGKLGRERVCCLFRKGVTLPSDIHGLIYKEFREHVGEVKWDIIKELRAAGYKVTV